MEEINLLDIIKGSLLSDASVKLDTYKNSKYFTFRLTAKDKNYLEWVRRIFNRFKIHCWITHDNKVSNVHSLCFYINTSPRHFSQELLNLRDKWYKKINGKTIKTVPRDLKLTPTTLLFWYLGDGSLIRRKNDDTRVPPVVFATNSFLKADVEFLCEKLKELGLNFYIAKDSSLRGFRKERKTEYLLYSSTQDGTPFRFFKLIGFECSKEIANCITGRKGKFHELHYFKDKWPTKEDWIKIFSNVKEIGPILKGRRLELGLSQNQLAKKIGIRRENIRDVELMKRNFSVKNFRKILETLNLDVDEILKMI
jgi:DNA-binding XRE family transcriptional regulator